MKKKKEVKEKKKKVLNPKIRNVIAIVLLIIIASSLFYIFNSSKIGKDENSSMNNELPPMEELIKEPTESNELKEKISKMKEENSDVKGWIKVGTTLIDYPLLQGSDNDYYLDHDYKKDYDIWGSIYIHNESNLDDKNSNVIIYGHSNNGNKALTQMFSTLLLFEDKEYYEKNKTITITTLEEEREYVIFSVFKSRVFYQDEINVFRYYNYLDLSNKSTFEEYVSNVKNLELYKTDITAEYDEQLLTLITCEYSTENGRLVVVAKRVR